MSKRTFYVHGALALLSIAVLGCGGGEDQEGALAGFGVSPAALTVEWSQDDDDTTPPVCGATNAGRVFINGGAGPYTLQNSHPGLVALTNSQGNTISQVDTQGGSFDVVVLGGCVDPATITVVDALGRRVTATVQNIPAEE
jgi:hypothetical protein